MVVVALVVLSGLWLKELTERRARYAADMFMGQTLTRLGWEHDTFIPVFWHDLKGAWHWPGWYISYSTFFAIGEPLSIYVDVFGRVRTANMQVFADMVEMPEKQRIERQADMIRGDIAFWEKADRERAQRKAEQGAAPLPSAPQTVPSDGAR